MLNDKTHKSIKECVLCWLATASSNGVPNVSPKEMFVSDGDKHLLIANIASPVSEENIKSNKNVCVSFIDIFKQKGFKVKGAARIINKRDEKYCQKLEKLHQLGGEGFPVKNIFEISIDSISPIIAPSYWLFPEITEQNLIEQSMNTYGVTPPGLNRDRK